MLRNLTAEALGTGLLMAVVVGSTLMGTRLSDDPAMGLWVTSVCAGLALFVAITILTPVSGGHLNPVVSLAFWLRGEVTPKAMLAYGAAQVIGAVLGAALAHVMFDLPAFQTATTARNQPTLWLSEVIATAGLVLVILGGIAAQGPVPALVGAYITAGYWFTSSMSFANPAMTLARIWTDSATGLRALDLPAYLVAQFVGAGLGYGLGQWLFAKEKPPGLADGG